jgi:membrane-associated phospholipid phosphatase
MKTNNVFCKVILILIFIFNIHHSFCQNLVLNLDSSKYTINNSIKSSPDNDLSIKGKNVFRLNPGVDWTITLAGSAWSIYTMTKIYNKGASTLDQINSLSKDDINKFDRYLAIYPWDSALDKESYYPFYAAFPLPFIFFLTGSDMRNDFWQLSFLYWETMAATGITGFSATYFENKYRPYAYDPGTRMDIRTGQGAKNSFYAGHVEVVAASSFFIAQIYASYYPESNAKWVFYGGASAFTLGMGYMRLASGNHFPSDILLGMGVGSLTGMLVPYFHNHHIIKNTDLSLTPFSNSNGRGLSLVYNFNK